MHRLDALNVVEKDRLDYASEAVDGCERRSSRNSSGRCPTAPSSAKKPAPPARARPDVRDRSARRHQQLPARLPALVRLHRAGGERRAAARGGLRSAAQRAVHRQQAARGAVLNDKRIRVTERKDLTGAMLITGFPPRERERAGAQLDCLQALLREAEDCAHRFGRAGLRLRGAAAAPTAYFESGVKPWDIAAGVLLVREAGGRVTDFRGAATGPMDSVAWSAAPAGRRQPEGLRRAAEDHRGSGLRERVLSPLRSASCRRQAAHCAAFSRLERRRARAAGQAPSSRAFGIRSCFGRAEPQQQRTGDEDRGQRADHDADHQRLGHALQRQRRRRCTGRAPSGKRRTR